MSQTLQAEFALINPLFQHCKWHVCNTLYLFGVPYADIQVQMYVRFRFNSLAPFPCTVIFFSALFWHF